MSGRVAISWHDRLMHGSSRAESPSRHSGKIFGLGLSRTGTRSLHAALEMLGYSSVHFSWPYFRYGTAAAYLGLRQLCLRPGIDREFDALVDTSVLPVWKELDATHSGSKFVLTTREKESWLDACSRFPPFRPEFRPPFQLRALRTQVYGCVHFDRRRFSDAYDRHHDDVLAYFHARERDLLILDVCAGEGFERLCPFLGLQTLTEPFPWEHKDPQRG